MHALRSSRSAGCQTGDGQALGPPGCFGCQGVGEGSGVIPGSVIVDGAGAVAHQVARGGA